VVRFSKGIFTFGYPRKGIEDFLDGLVPLPRGYNLLREQFADVVSAASVCFESEVEIKFLCDQGLQAFRHGVLDDGFVSAGMFEDKVRDVI
jgi:hypothetical protein